MKKILEAILAINLAVLSCIVFINIILRYGFQTSILSVDELSRYLFVWLTFIGAIVAFMDNAHVQVTFGRCEQVPDMRSCLSSGAIEQGSS